MKKIIVFLVFSTIAANAQFFPQGMVTLDSTASDTPIYYLSPGTVAPAEVYVEVLARPTGADIFQSVDVMSERENTVRALDLGGGKGTAYYFYDGSVNVFNVTPGTSADFIVRAWTGAATFDDAFYKCWAQSAVITQNTAIYDDFPFPPPENLLNFNTALTLFPPIYIPEPATLALLALGGAALFFRRRQ